MRVTLEVVTAVRQRDRPHHGRDLLDLGRLVHARAGQMEVVDVAFVLDLDRVRAGIEVPDGVARGIDELDEEPGADGAEERRALGAIAARERKKKDGDNAGEQKSHRPLDTRATPDRIHAPRSSAPNRSASALTIRPRSSAASSSDSVRSADWE